MKAVLKFAIEEYRITVFNLGCLALDGGAMFGVVPKTIWNRLMTADEQNRINLATNCLLIEYQNHKLFVDAGMGTKFSEKYQKIYGIQQETGENNQTPVDLALASVGLKSGDITQVLFTHLHFDHAGGATRLLPDGTPNGTIVPTFENACYVVHQGEWHYAICPHERCRASYLKENLEPVLKADKLRLLESTETEILPGLRLQVTGGHTPYHQILTLDTPSGGFVYWGDLIPTRHHVRIPFVMGYDEYPIETMEAKRRLLKETVSKNWLHVFEHDPEVPACRLQATDQPDVYEQIVIQSSEGLLELPVS